MNATAPRTALNSERRSGPGVRIASQRFGGRAGQIAVMHPMFVEERRCIGKERFLHVLNYCILLRGSEAQQLAIYIGSLLHETKAR